MLSKKLGYAILTEAIAVKVPKLYGLVILNNVVLTTLFLLKLGMKVGEARKKYNVPLPTMYSNGNSESDKMFNCVQRGHQQALETYPQFVAMSLLGGIRHPIVCSLTGIAWLIARDQWAKGYATGDPDNRYSKAMAKHIWTCLFIVMAASLSTASGVLGIY